jgi:hypothetical protein
VKWTFYRIGFFLLLAMALAAIFFLAYKPNDIDSSLRVYTSREDCIVGGPGQEEAFAGAEAEAAVGSWLAKSSVSALRKYLQDAANSTSSHLMTGIGDLKYYKIIVDQSKNMTAHNNLSCLVVLTGSFGRLDIRNLPTTLKSPQYLKTNDPDELFVKTKSGVTDFSQLIKFGLVDFPRTYFEFQVERESYSKTYRLKPTVAYVREFNSTGGQNDLKTAEFTVTLAKPALTGALEAPNSTGDQGLIGEIPMIVSKLKKGRLGRADIVMVDDFKTVWMAEPEGFRKAVLSEVSKSSLGAGDTVFLPPVNLYVTYREVDRPELLFYVLSKIVDENSEGITKTLSTGLGRGLQPD